MRTVNIRCTNPGKKLGERSPPKVTTRPIHKIAVIVPVGRLVRTTTGETVERAGGGLDTSLAQIREV